MDEEDYIQAQGQEAAFLYQAIQEVAGRVAPSSGTPKAESVINPAELPTSSLGGKLGTIGSVFNSLNQYRKL